MVFVVVVVALESNVLLESSVCISRFGKFPELIGERLLKTLPLRYTEGRLICLAAVG